jgi:hypothetical protein
MVVLYVRLVTERQTPMEEKRKNMLQLPNVTLVVLTGKDFEGHERAIKKSCEGVEWGGVKLVFDYKLDSIDKWNEAIIYELPHYIDTDFAMLIHADGYVINPEAWRPEFLNYDFIGAPWPLPTDTYSYRDDQGVLRRVGNSVSIRSKRLMELVATTPKDYFWSFKEKYGNTNEDGYISCHTRSFIEERGCIFAPLEEAIYFSKEAPLPENEGIETFAFHHYDG